MLWVGQGSVAEVVALQRQIDTYRQGAIRALRERNRVSRSRSQEFKSGLDSVEEMAREELGMVREGETFYLLVKP
jgi:cell division protein FtsB